MWCNKKKVYECNKFALPSFIFIVKILTIIMMKFNFYYNIQSDPCLNTRCYSDETSTCVAM